MEFYYTGSAAAISSQQLPWGVALVLAGIGIGIIYIRKRKSIAVLLAACALVFSGAWIGYQSMLLKSHPGDWEIRINQNTLYWESPQETVDASFSTALDDIQYVLVENWVDASVARKRYTLVTSSEKIVLDPISGVNLEQLSQALANNGVERKQVEIDMPK